MWDLARAHVAAIEQFDAVMSSAGNSSVVMNVGTGAGVTVKEPVESFERVFGAPVPLRMASAREGDAAGAFANVDKIKDLLGWSTKLTLDDGITSALGWSRKRREVLGYE